MKTHHHPKLKTSFSCGFFRRCTQSVLSPTTTTLPVPSSDPTSSPLPPPASSSESSSSSNTSQSFTQWRFPLPSSPPISHTSNYPSREAIRITPPVLYTNLEEVFHVAELQVTTCSDLDKVKVMYLLEHSLVSNPLAAVDGSGNSVTCPRRQ